MDFPRQGDDLGMEGGTKSPTLRAEPTRLGLIQIRESWKGRDRRDLAV